MIHKITISVGHNRNEKGAKNSYLNISEWQICYVICQELVNKLNDSNRDAHFIYDLALPAKVKEINFIEPDLAIEIHMNAFKELQNGHLCMHWKNSKKGYHIANKISTFLDHNRERPLIEVKHSWNKGGYFLSKTKCPAVIIELCFIDNLDDLCITVNKFENINHNIYTAIRKSEQFFSTSC